MRQPRKQLGMGACCNPYFGQVLPEYFLGDTYETASLSSWLLRFHSLYSHPGCGDTKGKMHTPALSSCPISPPLCSPWGKQSLWNPGNAFSQVPRSLVEPQGVGGEALGYPGTVWTQYKHTCTHTHAHPPPP